MEGVIIITFLLPVSPLCTAGHELLWFEGDFFLLLLLHGLFLVDL